MLLAHARASMVVIKLIEHYSIHFIPNTAVFWDVFYLISGIHAIGYLVIYRSDRLEVILVIHSFLAHQEIFHVRNFQSQVQIGP